MRPIDFVWVHNQESWVGCQKVNVDPQSPKTTPATKKKKKKQKSLRIP